MLKNKNKKLMSILLAGLTLTSSITSCGSVSAAEASTMQAFTEGNSGINISAIDVEKYATMPAWFIIVGLAILTGAYYLNCAKK